MSYKLLPNARVLMSTDGSKKLFIDTGSEVIPVTGSTSNEDGSSGGNSNGGNPNTGGTTPVGSDIPTIELSAAMTVDTEAGMGEVLCTAEEAAQIDALNGHPFVLVLNLKMSEDITVKLNIVMSSMESFIARGYYVYSAAMSVEASMVLVRTVVILNHGTDRVQFMMG